jgi:putative peptide zinc metalloprotease protein
LLRALAFNVMLVAGISTLIVNGNPLLRYDAYYILSDLIEMPNLAQRGQRYLTYLWDRYVFKAREADAPAESASEKRWLVCYTIASWCYRVLITVSIILFIASEFFIFGTLLALWGAVTLFGMPIWKGARHVLQSPALHRRRTQAIRLSLALVAAVVFFVCVVPMPMRTLAEGVVWLPEQAILRAGGNGVFQRWLVEPGTPVARGTPVLTLDDPLLAAELAVAQAKVEEALARYRIEQFNNTVKAEISRQQLEHEQRVLERTAERFARLIVRAEADGVLIVPKPQDMAGQFFKKGELLGYVLDRKQLIARVVVTQDNIDLVRTRFRSVELRLAEQIAAIYPSSVIREMPGGVEELPTAALGANGGGAIAVDPKDSNGVKTLERVFIFDLQLPAGATPKVFGERVHVRFDHGGEPLLGQGYRRVRQLFLSRFNV